MFDTNVVIDLRERDGAWLAWSERALASARLQGPTAVSAVVLGELASGGGTRHAITGLLERFGLEIRPLSNEAAFHAGVAHRAYRSAGGLRRSLLGDFLIGGHALSVGATLVTRDARRYRTYFPDLTLITPETDHG
jgi:predicted nucleic acid-binding protein